MKALRLDVYLSEKGLVKSRQRAKDLIKAGQVIVDGKTAEKPAMEVDESHCVKIEGEQLKYVGRGGLKLEKALKEFEICLENRICIDIGASTGGFTDCMLKSGAAYVYAVDVGHGQLDDSLKSHEQVSDMEGSNILDMTYESFPKAPDFISADVSFVSLKRIIPKIYELLPEEGEAVALIKPQFEAGRTDIGKGGIVRDRKVHVRVLDEVTDFAAAVGFAVNGLTFSPISGGDGNIEYLVHLKKSGVSRTFDYRKIAAEAFDALKV